MPALVPWQPDTANQVLQHLHAGRCVTLPTESTYEIVASAFHADGLPATSEPPAIVISSYPQVFDWLPGLEGAGERLFRKAGPGPFVFRAAGHDLGLTARLPEPARRRLTRENRLALRWPDHPIWNELSHVDMPLISAALPGGINSEATASSVGDKVACIVDAGPTTHAKLPSIVDGQGRRCRCSREGILTSAQIDAITCCRIVFICTGNTCRSPMASALCIKLLADALGCKMVELREHGFDVQSAGLAAMMGSEASPEAVQVAGELGADLAQHRSAPVSLELLQWADFIFTMTAGHWHTLRSIDVPGLPLPRMLSPRFEDIADPIGGELLHYRTCAQQIAECLQAHLPEFLEA